MKLFYNLFQKLLDMNDFHSSKAILSGLQSAAVYRLEQTWTVGSQESCFPQGGMNEC